MSSVRRILYPGRRYLWRDEFNDDRAVNTLNGTPATPGPGTRLITDTNARISIANGVLNFATGAAINDGWWLSSPLIARLNGQVGSFRVNPSDTNGIINVGLDANTSGAILDCLVFAAAGALQVIANGGTAVAVGVYTATPYEVKAVMRATGMYWLIRGGVFTTWTLLRPTLLGSAAGYAAITAGSATSVFTADYDRGPARTFLLPVLAHDTMTRDDGPLGNTEPTGPDNQGAPILAWTGATWTIATNQAINTPVAGGELWDAAAAIFTTGTYAWAASGGNTIANVANALQITYVDDANGAYVYLRNAADLSSDLTVGVWYQYQCDAKINLGSASVGAYPGSGASSLAPAITGAVFETRQVTFRALSTTLCVAVVRNLSANEVLTLDNLSLKPLTLSELFASLQDVGTPNVVIDATLAAYTTGTQMGIVARLDSAAAPANFIIANQDDANVKITECVAGVYTNLATVASAFAASDVLRLDLSGANYRLYKITSAGVATLISASTTSILVGNLHGMFDTLAGSGNAFSKFTVLQKTGYSIPE